MMHDHSTDKADWPDIVVESLRAHRLEIISYVPDVVTWKVLSKLEADPDFKVVPAAREDEAIGIVAGAYAARKKVRYSCRAVASATASTPLAHCAFRTASRYQCSSRSGAA